MAPSVFRPGWRIDRRASDDVTDATRLARERGVGLHELEHLVVGDLVVVLLRGLLDEFGLHAELGAVVDDVDTVVFER